VGSEVSEARKAAAIKAMEYLGRARVVGLGTGSTVEVFLRLASGRLMDRVVVASSTDTALLASQLGLRVLDPSTVDRVDLYVDSADEVDLLGRMVKGGGAAMTMEKVLASAADLRVFVVDELKVVPRVPHARPIPVEVLPQAISFVRRRLGELGYSVSVRVSQGKRGPVVTDLGGVVLDVTPPRDADLVEVARTLRSIPGVVEHGLFVDLVDVLVIGRLSGSVETVTFRR
jgi:ribose 5-phosphate isomerase A